MRKKYLLIQSNKGGEPCTFLDDIQDVLDNAEDYGIAKFLDSIPDRDPNYWEEGEALLLEIAILRPKSKTIAFRIDN